VATTTARQLTRLSELITLTGDGGELVADGDSLMSEVASMVARAGYTAGVDQRKPLTVALCGDKTAYSTHAQTVLVGFARVPPKRITWCRWPRHEEGTFAHAKTYEVPAYWLRLLPSIGGSTRRMRALLKGEQSRSSLWAKVVAKHRLCLF